MSLRMPRNLSSQSNLSTEDSALAYEINAEKAVTLGLLGRRLKSAIDALHAFEGGKGERAKLDRDHLVEDAARALWEFVVHRDCCGFSGTDYALNHYNVPPEVRARMGAVAKSGSGGK